MSENKLPYIFKWLILGIIISFIIGLTILPRYISVMDIAGYYGVFALSFLGSASMILPVPGLISMCGVSAILDPILIGIIAAIAETIGELSGYILGVFGSYIIEKKKFYLRLNMLMKNRGYLIIFIFSIIPNPLFDIVGISAGILKFSIFKFLVVVLVGKLLKCVLISLACDFGINMFSMDLITFLD